MMKLSLGWLVGLILLVASAGPAAASPPPPLVVVSIDGFRADYLDRNLTPTLAAIARDGVRAKAMRPKEDYDQWLASTKAKSR